MKVLEVLTTMAESQGWWQADNTHIILRLIQ